MTPPLQVAGSKNAWGILGSEKRRGKERADEEEQKKKNSKHDKEEKKDPAEYPAGFSYSWNCASGHVDYKNK